MLCKPIPTLAPCSKGKDHHESCPFPHTWQASSHLEGGPSQSAEKTWGWEWLKNLRRLVQGLQTNQKTAPSSGEEVLNMPKRTHWGHTHTHRVAGSTGAP